MRLAAAVNRPAGKTLQRARALCKAEPGARRVCEGSSFLLEHDGTADRRSPRLRNRFVGQRCGNGQLQIVAAGLWSLLANVEIAVVDAAVVDLMHIGRKHGRFGRDGGMSALSRRLRYIKQTVLADCEVLVVLENHMSVV